MLLRLFGATVGRDVYIYPTASVWAPWNLTLGDGSVVGPGTELYCVSPIVLEEHSNVAQRCFLCTASHDHRYLSKPLIHSAIRIQRHAWLAAEVFVGPGVTVGTGAVCGGRAAVFKNVDPWTIVGGNPARFIKNRALLDQAQVEAQR